MIWTQLRYVAIAAVLLAGCPKEPKPGPANGSAAPDAAGALDARASTPDAAGSAGSAGVPPPPPHPAAQGESCPEGTPCASGLVCLRYIGVTGKELASCEIPCAKAKCPPGQACVTLKDGPGQVCQARGGTGGTKGSGGGEGSGGSGSTGTPPPLPGQAQPCAAGKCASGLTCVEYYGIAGPRGPKLTSCEVRCGAGRTCAGGQKCVTVADGPGQVCRP